MPLERWVACGRIINKSKLAHAYIREEVIPVIQHQYDLEEHMILFDSSLGTKHRRSADLIGHVYEVEVEYDENNKATIRGGIRFAGLIDPKFRSSSWETIKNLIHACDKSAALFQESSHHRNDWLRNEMKEVNEAYKRLPAMQRQAFLAAVMYEVMK